MTVPDMKPTIFSKTGINLKTTTKGLTNNNKPIYISAKPTSLNIMVISMLSCLNLSTISLSDNMPLYWTYTLPSFVTASEIVSSDLCWPTTEILMFDGAYV